MFENELERESHMINILTILAHLHFNELDDYFSDEIETLNKVLDYLDSLGN